MKKINFYLEKGQIREDKTVVSLSKKYLDKARYNLITMNLLSEINSEKLKKQLSIPKNYDSYDWVVICGYYAMYSAALSLIASLGFRSKNHSATISILEEYFFKKKDLDKKDLWLIENALFQKEELEKLSDARQKREIAQYSVTKQTTKEIAERIKEDAYNFVNKCEKILEK